MDVPQTPEQPQPSADPRLQPTPQLGSLCSGELASHPQAAGKRRLFQLIAIMAGIVSALVVSSFGGPIAVLGKIGTAFAPPRKSATSSWPSDRDLDRQSPQRQAEILLARAVSRNDGTTDQIQARLGVWRGQLHWDSQLSELTTVALNSSDYSVRESAIEVQLAAYGLSKKESSVEALARQAESRDHARKIWSLYTLGLLGNRGVETSRVVQLLTGHLLGQTKDSDEDSRRWAVEGLALVGTSPSIAPLLDAMHSDPSPLVRERAACSLAESGMLTHEQRMMAVPQLISYSDDPTLDHQTHAWAFRALADITQQHLPNDSAAWRTWYQTREQ